KFVFSANDFDEGLAPCFNYLGIDFQKTQNQNLNERDFGFKIIEQGTLTKVSLVAPYSPSWKAALFNNDDVIAVNGTVVRNNLNQLLNYYSNEKSLEISIISQEKLRTVILQKDEKGRTWFFKSKLSVLAQSADKQKDSFDIWKTF
ncbi:MAG: hypothetical protein KBG47_02125, partial [Bacteroidia bacterium]|nr:hypothetical protein [Bacteroidia bacterium]